MTQSDDWGGVGSWDLLDLMREPIKKSISDLDCLRNLNHHIETKLKIDNRLHRETSMRLLSVCNSVCTCVCIYLHM